MPEHPTPYNNDSPKCLQIRPVSTEGGKSPWMENHSSKGKGAACFSSLQGVFQKEPLRDGIKAESKQTNFPGVVANESEGAGGSQPGPQRVEMGASDEKCM